MYKVTILSTCILLSLSSINAQTQKMGTVIDIDGNVYKTVVIGKYEWMAENLKTTRYSNGTAIPNITESSEWITLTSGAYCWYNNKMNSTEAIGALYNWYAVNTGSLCPDGWRVPSDEEWKYLEGYVDTQYGVKNPIWDKSKGRGFNVGKQLKSTSGWNYNGNGANSYNFNALPGGERLSRNGVFFISGSNGFWWSSTENDQTSAWYRCIIYSFDDVYRNIHPKKFGFSVRCMRDSKAE